MLLLRLFLPRVYLCLGFGLLALATVARADAVLVRFRPPATGIAAGYKLYYALETSGPITSTPVDLGLRTPDSSGVASYSLAGLDPTRSYSLELTAYDSSGSESRRSNRLSVAARSETLGAVLWQQNFDSYAPGVHVPGFIDTRGSTDSGTAGNVWTVAYKSDGSVSDYSGSDSGATATRYAGTETAGWGSYEIAGRVRLENINAGGAVGARWTSGGHYFELGQDASSWALSGNAEPALSCAGSPQLGVKPTIGRWYSFKYRVTRSSTTGLYRLRAKVWLQGGVEPAWQADCWTTLGVHSDSGSFLLARDGSGGVYFDDLTVTSVVGTLAPIPPQ
jgi:hypothetical protein